MSDFYSEDFDEFSTYPVAGGPGPSQTPHEDRSLDFDDWDSPSLPGQAQAAATSDFDDFDPAAVDPAAVAIDFADEDDAQDADAEALTADDFDPQPPRSASNRAPRKTRTATAASMTSATTTTGSASGPASETRARRKIPTVQFVDIDGPPLAQAVALALGVMKWLKVNSWAEVPHTRMEILNPSLDDSFRRLYAGLELTVEQQELLAYYRPFLGFLRVNPLVTISYCPACFDIVIPRSPDSSSLTEGREISPVQAHGWAVVSKVVPTKCRLTAGCDAKPVKVPAASRVKQPTAAERAAAQALADAASQPSAPEQLALELSTV